MACRTGRTLVAESIAASDTDLAWAGDSSEAHMDMRRGCGRQASGEQRVGTDGIHAVSCCSVGRACSEAQADPRGSAGSWLRQELKETEWWWSSAGES